jgi:NAD(P)-dependent dehydrogenase (short-subunit alcohol dehydrogenase family)
MNAVKPHLDSTKGAFVTTASLAGVVPGGSSLAYAISKAAQIYLVKTLSKICAPHIRVNSMSRTLMLIDWGLQFSEEQQLAQAESSRLKRLITVEVCVLAPLQCALCSRIHTEHRQHCAYAAYERIHDRPKHSS